MSNCIKDLYDYDLIKKCCFCKKISLKSNFNKNTKSKDGFQSQCKFCVNDYKKKTSIIKIAIQNSSVVKNIILKIMER